MKLDPTAQPSRAEFDVHLSESSGSMLLIEVSF